MKKVFVTILIVLYFTTSMGATIRMHFCMGELISWSLNTKAKDDKCSKCDMKCQKGCCEEKCQVVKVGEDQHPSKVSFEFSKSTFQVKPTIYQKWRTPMISITVVDFPKANAPPDKDKVPLFVRNSAFRI